MKKLSIILFTLFTCCQAFAQRTSMVNVNVFGNRNVQVAIDGSTYNLSSASGAQNKSSVALSNIAVGMHTLTINRTNNNRNNNNNVTTQFNLRRNFDMTINVNANGSLELIETRRGNGTTTGGTTTRNPMTDADFYTLNRNVRAQRTASGRYTLLNNTFNSNTNYFTSRQVAQLIQQVSTSSEAERLALAKLSYRTVVDPNNFYLVVNLFSNTTSRNDLDDYVYYYEEDGTGTPVPGNNTRVAMSDASFSSLYNTIRGQWPVSTQVNSINTAFNNTSYAFTAYQAAQLISLVTNESYRLQLAKASYRSIVDPANFYSVSALISSQVAKDELAAYIGGQVNTGGTYRIAMSDAEYTELYNTINGQFLPFQQMNSLTTTFNNASYYFTTAQAKRLILLVSNEANRLTLAKAAYRNLVDRANYTSFYDLFTTQSYRNDLNAYVQAYRD